MDLSFVSLTMENLVGMYLGRFSMLVFGSTSFLFCGSIKKNFLGNSGMEDCERTRKLRCTLFYLIERNSRLNTTRFQVSMNQWFDTWMAFYTYNYFFTFHYSGRTSVQNVFFLRTTIFFTREFFFQRVEYDY